MSVRELADELTLGGVLGALRRRAGHYDLLEHWQQGEFHHDTVVRVDPARSAVPGPILVIATNCNGGVKEVLCFREMPTRSSLWHHRCPENPDFAGPLPEVLDRAATLHWFDPCELLSPDARSEYRPEFRERQPGGGWTLKECGATPCGPSEDDALW